MDQLIQFSTDPHVWVGLAIYWVVSALVSGMPQPSTESSVAYVWFYSSLHILMANLNSIMTRKAGQLPAPAPLDPPAQNPQVAPVEPAQPKAVTEKGVCVTVKVETTRASVMLSVVTAVFGLIAGIVGTWISGISANGTQLTQMSVSVANMQSQMKEIQDGIKEARIYADSNYVRQDRFDQFIKAYDTNHSDAVAYRANTDAKLDQIMTMLNQQGIPRRKDSR